MIAAVGSVVTIGLALLISGTSNGVPVKAFPPCLRPDVALWACQNTKGLYRDAVGWHNRFVKERDKRTDCVRQFLVVTKDHTALRAEVDDRETKTAWAVVMGAGVVLAAGLVSGYFLGRASKKEEP